MNQEKFTSTNKADFYRVSSGQLLKRYTTENAIHRAAQDQRSLTYLNRHFSNVLHQGWAYDVVQFISKSSDNRGICMNFVAGSALSSLPATDSICAEYHCGIWLALYHNKIIPGSYKGLIFTDLNVHNIIVNKPDKRITVIDPGMAWGQQGIIYEDVIKHLNSILLVLVVRGKSSLRSILTFLEGYNAIVGVKFRPGAYYKGLFSELRRQFIGHAEQSWFKSFLFGITVIVLSLFYLVIVPWLMSRYERE